MLGGGPQEQAPTTRCQSYAPPTAHGFCRALTATARAYLFNVRALAASALQVYVSFSWRFCIGLSTARFFRLAFLHRSFKSALLATDISSLVFLQRASFDWRFCIILSTARFFLLALLSAFQPHASCDWRFFQPFNRTLLSAGVSLSLSRAHFLQLAFLSAFRAHASCGWCFSRPFNVHGLSSATRRRRGREGSLPPSPRTDPGVRFSRTGLFRQLRFRKRYTPRLCYSP